jgi:hypothetical protein
VKITEGRLRRIIREALSRKGCHEYSHSLAWIDPDGGTHAVKPNYFTHAHWADQSFIADRALRAEFGEEEALLMHATEKQRELLRLGWVRVVNGTHFMIENEIDELTDEAVSAIIKLMGDCAKLQENEIEDTEVYFDSKVTTLSNRSFNSIADFVDEWGSPSDIEELYSSFED